MTEFAWLAGATLEQTPVSALALSFFAYAFAGWAYESTICALLNHGHFANSGFLLGPCCPIYGVGALACWLLLRGIDDLWVQFAAAAVVCCALEYVVGLLLERTTHARFWDYSNFPLNINGRVCLYGALLFGSGAVLICRVAEPGLLAALSLAPAPVLRVAAAVLVAVLAADTVFALASWRRLSGQLEVLRTDMADRINESLRETSDSLLERIPASALDSANTAYVRGRAVNAWLADVSDAAMEALRERAEIPSFRIEGAGGLHLAVRRASRAAARWQASAASSLSRRDLRFFNAFPRLRMLPYEGVIRATRLKDRARELFRRR